MLFGATFKKKIRHKYVLEHAQTLNNLSIFLLLYGLYSALPTNLEVLLSALRRTKKAIEHEDAHEFVKEKIEKVCLQSVTWYGYRFFSFGLIKIPTVT